VAVAVVVLSSVAAVWPVAAVVAAKGTMAVRVVRAVLTNLFAVVIGGVRAAQAVTDQLRRLAAAVVADTLLASVMGQAAATAARLVPQDQAAATAVP
jgi:hypothetical protein